MFRDRVHAGETLAARLRGLRLDRPLVLGIPRGGVVVAAPIAGALGGELDVAVVRKIGAPHNPELGLGAVGAHGEAFLDRRLVDVLRVDAAWLDAEIARLRQEAARRVESFRGPRPEVLVGGRDVVVVDDGIATGGTATAAGRVLRAATPARLVLAVPVAPRESLAMLGATYDEVVALDTPEPFRAVGQWYADFRQVSDDQVSALLRVPTPERRGQHPS